MSDTPRPIPTFTVDQRAFTLLGENLYEGRLAAIWAREVLQNAIDAGARSVTITYRQGMFREQVANFDFLGVCQYDWQGQETAVLLTCEDDGIGMDEDVLLDAFLKLGGSFKLEAGTVGGFGVAKAIILCGQRWSVDSNDLHLDHGMMGIEPVRTVDEPREGTRIEMGILTKNYSRWQFEDLRNCLVLSNVPGVRVRLIHLSADGRTLSDEIVRGIRPGKQIDDLGWATLSTNAARSDTYRGLHVRARGLYQYTEYLSHDTCAFLDIPELPRAGDVTYPLTVSRETLKTERKTQVQAVIQRLVVEPSQARHRDVEDETLVKFEGRRKAWDPLDEPEAVPYYAEAALLQPTTALHDVLPKLDEWNPTSGGLQYESGDEDLRSPLGFPFLVLRHRKFRHLRTERTRKGMRLLNVWHSLVSEVVDILGSTYTLDDEVCVGLVMRENTAAMYYREGETRGILVNPRGMRLGDPVKTLMPRLLYRLVEELLHSGGLSVHDESLHYETFGAFDRLLRDHHARLEGAVRRGLAAPTPSTI